MLFLSIKTTETTEALREAPPILKLEEHEKFRDDAGNVFEVEVRGVREEEKIYFRGKDVERLFEMNNLINDIRLKQTSYKLYEDYILFLVTQIKKFSTFGSIESKTVKRTFLTYNGLLKVIYIILNVTLP